MMPSLNPDERPIFSHQLRALRARMERDDRDIIGITLRRAGFRQEDVNPAGSPGKGSHGRSLGQVNFFCPSPITGRDRQTGGRRVPHFSFQPHRRVYVPTSATGQTHPRYSTKAAGGGDHFDYIVEGAEVTWSNHIDYIYRHHCTQQERDAGLTKDALDERDERALMNDLAFHSNIPGGRERQRSLFEAAERVEATPKVHSLTASTKEIDAWEALRGTGTAPDWIVQACKRLRRALIHAEMKARQSKKKVRHAPVEIASVTLEEAYERLIWLDQHAGADAKLADFKQGKTGRAHYRFVAELPDGLSHRQNFEVLKRFGDSLAAEGWMFAAGIHLPDPHSDSRNKHFHLDAYDRPSRWLNEHGCWDFEYCVRKNGKNTYPLRQKKIGLDREVDADGRKVPVNIVARLRERYINIVNDVVGDRDDIPVYVSGTYKANGIPLTPLAHLGNAMISAEKNGRVTAAGMANAWTLIADDFAAAERRMRAQIEELEMNLAVLRPLAQQGGFEDHLSRFEKLKRSAISRNWQLELVELTTNAAKSRAEAVVRRHGHDPAVGRSDSVKRDLDLLARAREHLAWVARHAPAADEVARERGKVRRFHSDADTMLTQIQQQIEEHHAPMRYVPRAREDKLSTTSSAASPYAGRMLARLDRWFDAHIEDEAKLIVEQNAFRLAPGVPKTIDTLLRQFADEASIQARLRAEYKRRRKAERAAAEGQLSNMRGLRPSLAEGLSLNAIFEPGVRAVGRSRQHPVVSPLGAKGPKPSTGIKRNSDLARMSIAAPQPVRSSRTSTSSSAPPTRKEPFHYDLSNGDIAVLLRGQRVRDRQPKPTGPGTSAPVGPRAVSGVRIVPPIDVDAGPRQTESPLRGNERDRVRGEHGDNRMRRQNAGSSRSRSPSQREVAAGVPEPTKRPSNSLSRSPRKTSIADLAAELDRPALPAKSKGREQRANTDSSSQIPPKRDQGRG